MAMAQEPDVQDQVAEATLRNRKRASASSNTEAPEEAADQSAADQNKAVLEAEAIPRVHKHREQTAFGRATRSTPFKLFTLSIVGIVPAFGAGIALPDILIMLEADIAMRCFHWTITFWIIAQVMYNFAMSQFTDPGSTTKYKPTYEATGQYMLAPELDSEDESKRIWYAPNYCSKCQHWKPPRAHHCGMCGRCVLRMDHHCPFTGNCIGFRNHGHFAIMYMFAFVGLFYSAVLCTQVILRNWLMRRVIYHGLRPHKLVPFQNVTFISLLTRVATFLLDYGGPKISTLLLLTIIFLFAVFGCGCPALQIFAFNATTIELRFPMKDYVQIKPQVYCPLGVGFYRCTILQTLQDLLGQNWRWRLLLPIRGLLDETERGPGIMPLPAPVGTSQLRAKVHEVESEGVKSHSTYEELGINLGPAASAGEPEAERSVAEDTVDTSIRAPSNDGAKKDE